MILFKWADSNVSCSVVKMYRRRQNTDLSVLFSIYTRRCKTAERGCQKSAQSFRGNPCKAFGPSLARLSPVLTIAIHRVLLILKGHPNPSPLSTFPLLMTLFLLQREIEAIKNSLQLLAFWVTNIRIWFHSFQISEAENVLWSSFRPVPAPETSVSSLSFL